MTCTHCKSTIENQTPYTALDEENGTVAFFHKGAEWLSWKRARNTQKRECEDVGR